MELQMIDLFENVDASDLFPGEGASLDTERIKALTLGRIEKKSRRHLTSRILLAAAIAAALAVSGIAYREFRKYEDPRQLLDGFYGNRRQESIRDVVLPWGQAPDSERVALDEAAAALVEPFVADVSQTVTRGRTELTVHGALYDSVTGCGIVSYSLEDPEGIRYRLQYDGSLSGLPVYGGSRHGYAYLLKGDTGDTRLDIAEYFIRSPMDEENYIALGLKLPEDGSSPEEEFDRDQQAIRIPLDDGGGMPGLMAEGIRLSPIGILLDPVELGLEDSTGIGSLSLRFRDGSEYRILEEGLQNDIFAAECGEHHLVMPFNRLVNVEAVASVKINGREFRDLLPLPEEDRLRYPEYVENRGQLDGEDSTGTGALTQGDRILTPGKLQYSSLTRCGSLEVTLSGRAPEDLLENGEFYPWKADLEASHPVHWTLQETRKDSLILKGYFTCPEGAFLKLWFGDSPADPRLDHSTEHLLCFPLNNTAGEGQSFENGAILVSDLGIVLDCGALEIRQDAMPRDLSLGLADGSERILSSWDEDILEGTWLWTGELRDSREKKVYMTFFTPVDCDQVRSVTYAGHTFRIP